MSWYQTCNFHYPQNVFSINLQVFNLTKKENLNKFHIERKNFLQGNFIKFQRVKRKTISGKMFSSAMLSIRAKSSELA